MIRRGRAMIKILKRILNFIFRKPQNKDDVHVLASVNDGTLNLDSSEIGIEGVIMISEIHSESIKFHKNLKNKNKIIYINDYRK